MPEALAAPLATTDVEFEAAFSPAIADGPTGRPVDITAGDATEAGAFPGAEAP